MTVDEMFEQARVVRDLALRVQRVRFHARYGSFWKCGVCGAYVRANDPPVHRGRCWDHGYDPVELRGYSWERRLG